MKWKFEVPGIPDDYFLRDEKTPMTKEEIRVITLSKARIQKNNIIYDIGAGTGSISVEAALLANEGKVFAIEKDSGRIPILKANIVKFNLKNVQIVEGEAPEILENLPKTDRIIIGGSGGKMREILLKCDEKLKDGGVIVINIITIDSLKNSVSTLDDLNYNFKITQVSISRVEKLGTSRLFKALNPVFIIDASRL